MRYVKQFWLTQLQDPQQKHHTHQLVNLIESRPNLEETNLQPIDAIATLPDVILDIAELRDR